MKRFFFNCAFLFFSFCTAAQLPLNPEEAKAALKGEAARLRLSTAEINEAIVQTAYVQQPGNMKVIYLQQAVEGIPVRNAIKSIGLRASGVSVAGQFFPKATQKVFPQNAVPVLSASDALTSAFLRENLFYTILPEVLHVSKDGRTYRFSRSSATWEDVEVKLTWMPVEFGKSLRLSWEVSLPKNGGDHHLVQLIIDAVSGQLIQRQDQTTECNIHRHDAAASGGHQDALDKLVRQYHPEQIFQTSNTSGSQYLVSPFPAESPLHTGGSLALRTDPWLLAPAGSNATTLQWHNNGSVIYPHTRGNNVYAVEDRDGNNNTIGSPANSTTAPPALTFNPAVDFESSPSLTSNVQGGIVNLFYWNNIIHDFSYLYGFHELAGNFQVNNLGRGGAGNDAVNADAQDGSGINNANFSSPPDGFAPRMQMFLWNPSSLRTLKINNPESLAGVYAAVEGNLSTTGKLSNSGPVTASLAVYQDPVNGSNSQGCIPASNSAVLLNKIVLILRGGSCADSTRIRLAQNEGARAVIMINTSDVLSTMTGLNSNITIPGVMIGITLGNNLRNRVLSGENISVTLRALQIDADYDNGVIAHEYAHGISNRFTGGPAASGCLGNKEQMGEGWSDYYSLMTCTNWATTSVNDGGLRRAIGNYASGRDIFTGNGIRQFPYTTNMAINPLTYANLPASSPTTSTAHATGTVWCTMLWDMTWKLIEMDGINPNMYNAATPGGNSVAMRLVNEGMRLQACSPGFVDGRNAILRADTLLYNGRYSCAIWAAFARRGLGLNANQGSADITGNGNETTSTQIPNGIKVVKTASVPSASQGQNIDYTFKTKCECSPVNNFVIRDTLPANVTYVSGGSYNAATRVITFGGSLAAGDSLVQTARVTVNSNTYQPPVTHISETFSNASAVPPYFTLTSSGQNFRISSFRARTGTNSLYAQNLTSAEEKSAETNVSYSLTRFSKLEFYHLYDTESFYDGGIVELSTNGGSSWIDAGPYMIAGRYNALMDASTNFAIANRNAFSGSSSNQFIRTEIDLSSFAGQSIRFRFSFASDDATAGLGWFIDDISLISESGVLNIASAFTSTGEFQNSSRSFTPINGFALPVVWSEFTAEKSGPDALLKWATAQESNTADYEIERAVAGTQLYEKMGNVNARGNSSVSSRYQFTDPAVPAGIWLYRIKQNDKDGRFSYSETRKIQFAGQRILATLVPNVTRNTTVLSVTELLPNMQFQLINASGQVLMQQKVNSRNHRIQLPAGLPAGVYQIRVVSSVAEAETLPLIIK